MSPHKVHFHSKYTNMEVLTSPVGKTKILSFLAYQTLSKPKTTAMISRTMSKVE